MAFRDWDAEGMVPADCAKCHSATGLPQFIKNGGTVAVAGMASVRTTGVVGAEPANGFACTTCHNDLTKFTLYPVKGVPFPSGKTVSFSEKDDKGAYKDAVACQPVPGMPPGPPIDCHPQRQDRQDRGRQGAARRS